MFSMAETRVEKYLRQKDRASHLLRVNQKFVTRIYPKGQRIDSSNYDPVTMWNCGCQLIALNYQTPDRSMQINEGLFSMNGRCGYVLMPDCMHSTVYNPLDKSTLQMCNPPVEPLTIDLTIIGARHLPKSGRGIASPFVEVEIIGCSYDCNKYKTSTCSDNGFSPVWNEVCDFDICNPDVAMIRFVVMDEDMFGDPNFLGQATYPIKCLRQGYRSVQLRNDYSETLEISSLLVHITLQNPKAENDEIYSSIMQLRDKSDELQQAIQQREMVGDLKGAETIKQQLNRTQQQLIEKNRIRHNARSQVKSIYPGLTR
jgi:phosphatidylinositol phospholipase C gamma-1